MVTDNSVDLKLNLDFKGVNDALYQMIGQFNGTDKEFQKIANNIQKNAKNLEASIKLFGPASQQASAAAKRIEKDFQSLVANGIDPASDSFKKMTASMPTTAGLDATTSSLRKNNQQWSALALVVQDLPFGFRGIQNNLPALMGSVASAAGPMYLAFSALIAAVTAYDMGIFGATKKTVDFRKALKEVNDEVKNAINYTNSEVSNLEGLVDVMLDVNASESIRNKALAEAKEAITKVDEAQGKKIKTIGEAVGAVKLYTEAIKQQQIQEVIGKRIAEITVGQIEKRNTLAIETAKANRGIHPINWFMGNTELQNLQSEILSNEELLRQLEDFRKSNTKALLLNPFSKYNAKGQTAKQGEAEAKKQLELAQRFNEQVIQGLIDSKKLEVKLFEDDAYKKYEISLQLADLEKQLGLEKIKNSDYNDKQKAKLSEGVYKEYANQILLIDQFMQEQLLTQDAKARKEKKKRDEQELKDFTDAYKRQLSSFDQFYKDKQNLSTGNRLAQKSIYEQEASDLQYMLESNIITYDDYIKRLGETFKGWSNNNKAIAQEAATSIQQIGNGLMSALGPSMDMLLDKGASIGEVMNKMAEDLVKQLIKVIATAAIAALLMSIIFPEKLAAAGMSGMDVFSGLFTQGMGLGRNAFPTKKFANGGVISGPTMGLMGEYPGAAHNPEVVAPLDKLKSMIGGGTGGQFVLRGQDLLLSVNRAQKASNLKGQNISLA
jgi:hypothetical protein